MAEIVSAILKLLILLTVLELVNLFILCNTKRFHTQRSADELVFLYFVPDEVVIAMVFCAFTAEVVRLHLLNSFAILSVHPCPRNSGNTERSVLEFDTGELFQNLSKRQNLVKI